MKKRLCAFLLMLCVLTVGFPCFQVVADEATPYTDVVSMTELTSVSAGGVYSISNADEFFAFAEKCTEANNYFEDATVLLTADIDLNPNWEAGAEAPAKVWTPIALFKGDFDGQGHTVKGIYAGNASSEKSGKNEDTTGVFAAVWGSVTIQNFKIANSYFTANRNASALIGFTAVDDIADRKININNVTIDAQVVSTSDYAAGFIAQVFGAWNENAVITFNSCMFSGSVTAAGNGAAGFVVLPYRYMTFNDCVFSGTATADNLVAGFMAKEQGYSWYPVSFNRCASVGTLNTTYEFNGANNTSVFVAGFVAETANETVFTDCLSQCTFPYTSSAYATGGFIGQLLTFKATFTRCVNLSHSKNPTQYFNQALVAKVNAKTGNDSSAQIYAEDCFTEKNVWQENGANRESRGVGMYIGSNTATEWILTVHFTVRSVYSNKTYTNTFNQKDQLLDDWAYLYNTNTQWLKRSTLPADVELKGNTALFYLAAYDFTDTWKLVGDELTPMPAKAAEVLYGKITAAEKGVDFYGYQTKYVTDASTEETTLSLRLVATVDSLENYDKVGFRVKVHQADHAISSGALTATPTEYAGTLANNTVYESLTATYVNENNETVVEKVSVDGKYLAAWVIDGIPTALATADATAKRAELKTFILEVESYALSGDTETVGDTYIVLIQNGAVVSAYLK